ncbi:MAG TPA: GMC family oxidoreductase [Longimicrobium sp.]|nr:GMC family oxidoreductase [Longimicrobium sp.]
MTLSTAQMATLETLCRRMVPLADGDPRAAELARAVAVRLGTVDPEKALLISRLLTVLGHPATAALTSAIPVRFSRMAPARQDAWLAGWETSRIPARRTIFQALRRLVLSTFYSDPSTYAEIGYRGPLHDRAPAFAWEGPAPGEPTDEEPIARGRAAEPRILPIAPRDMGGVWMGRIIQGAALHAETRVSADVCVIGTGAGGAVMAARLAEAGMNVVILEEGGWWRGEDFTEREPEMTSALYADAGTRATDDLSVPMLQGRAVGGSTLVNWMIMLRTHDWVLDEWAAEHGTTGMSPADLAPVFDRIEAETHTRSIPDDAHNPPNRALLDGARALGWSAQAARINAKGCVRSGFCGLGCRYDAKQGTASVYVPMALRAGARLFTDVRADRIKLAEHGGRAPLKRVHGTVLDRATGQPRGRMTVEAPVVVIAAGAVGTPALLQRSGMGGGGVGRFLRLHPTTLVAGIYGREMYGGGGIPLSSVCDQFVRGDDGYGFWVECPPTYPALAAASLPGFGERHRRVMRSAGGMAPFIVLVRDGADRRASNGGVTTDRRGRIHIRYRLGPAEERTVRAGIKAAARIHFAAGAREVVTLHAAETVLRSAAEVEVIDRRPCGPNLLGVLSAHVNGTCRIGTDPRTSGCTPDGERHGVPGLYVADGSILPTAPGVNPQETIMALATVIADRIAARHPARAGAAGALAGTRVLTAEKGREDEKISMEEVERLMELARPYMPVHEMETGPDGPLRGITEYHGVRCRFSVNDTSPFRAYVREPLYDLVPLDEADGLPIIATGKFRPAGAEDGALEAFWFFHDCPAIEPGDPAMPLRFADFVERLASGTATPVQWVSFIIQHYPDQQLEEVRRKTCGILYHTEDSFKAAQESPYREQLLALAAALRARATPSGQGGTSP